MRKQKWTESSIGDQSGRIALVTGGNSGIGLETAKALAQHGARVIVAARSLERGQSAVDEITAGDDSLSVELELLDLADLSSVGALTNRLNAQLPRLDLLINNAGVMMPPERRETKDGFELQMGTNHLGHFALTLRLLPLIEATEGSRIVNVSSSAQNFGDVDLSDLQWKSRSFDRMKSYAASKTANMLFTLELQKRLQEKGSRVMVTSCHPGWTATNLQKDSGLFQFLNPFFGMKPWQGALPTLYAAVADEAGPGGYYGPNGLWNMRGYPASNEPAKWSLNAESARSLWSKSEDLTGVTW